MKASILSVFLASLATGALGEMRIKSGDVTAQQLQAFNAPNAVSMSALRERKVNQMEKDRAAGAYDKNRYKKSGPRKCKNGKAGEYSCNKVDLLAFLRHQDLGSEARAGNDIWGMCYRLS